MTFFYVVRCNFIGADREQAWNDWYSGAKTSQMLAKPMFRAAQRFRLASGSGRTYLALWQVERPEALTTAEYKADWGFAEWRASITDWSRDLFDARHARDADLSVPMRGALTVISFDGMDAPQANAARDALADDVAIVWFDSAGLDRHTPMIGLKPSRETPEAQLPLPSVVVGVQAGVYRPITEYRTAAAFARER